MPQPHERDARRDKYNLITTYMRVKQQQEREHHTDKLDVYIKAFLLFCAVIYSAFLIDGFLPFVDRPDVITKIQIGAGPWTNTGVKGVMRIETEKGHISTNNWTGYEREGLKVTLQRSFLFRHIRGMSMIIDGKYERIIEPHFDFYSLLIIWPILGLLTSVLGYMYQHKTGWLFNFGVLNLFGIIPFFLLLYNL